VAAKAKKIKPYKKRKHPLPRPPLPPRGPANFPVILDVARSDEAWLERLRKIRRQEQLDEFN
jgi:hypothetical protein